MISKYKELSRTKKVKINLLVLNWKVHHVEKKQYNIKNMMPRLYFFTCVPYKYVWLLKCTANYQS